MNEFNECVHEVFSAAGDIIIKSMMGGYLVYWKYYTKLYRSIMDNTIENFIRKQKVAFICSID